MPERLRNPLFLSIAILLMIAVVAVSPRPASAAEQGLGRFRTACDHSHFKQVDPIVNPGPVGTKSGHLHEFAGNTSTDSNSTYSSMIAAGTTCQLSADTAAYWVPALVGPGSEVVPMEKMTVYYTNRPVMTDGQETLPFPKDFRMIAAASYPHSYWNCQDDSDHEMDSRHQTPPDCGDSQLRLHIFFPSCWDGRLDSPDHQSHVAYGYRDGSVYGNPGATEDYRIDACPDSHTKKIPQVRYRIVYPVSDGTQYQLSDGTQLAHADFWNTWDQATLEMLTEDVLNAGVVTEALGDDNIDDIIPATFADIRGNTHEGNIEAIAAEGITKGCNPPVNDRFCPDEPVTRGQMAAFLVRALGLTDDGGGDLFVDDDGSVFESDIDRLGTAGVTKGCNPPVNDRFCPDDLVLRDQMASFLTRALGLDPITP